MYDFDFDVQIKTYKKENEVIYLSNAINRTSKNRISKTFRIFAPAITR